VRSRGAFPIVVMALLFALGAIVEALQMSSLSSLSNADMWWHLSTGRWIIQHHQLPQTGIFSQLPGVPWIASSWAYDLFLALAYRILQTRAIPALLMGFRLVLAVVVFLLAGGMRGRFWLAVVLSAVAQYVLGGFQPTPAYCSIILFGVELLLLNESRRAGSIKTLYWLPFLFLAWANLHTQFVYGVVLLLLFLSSTLLSQDGRQEAPERKGRSPVCPKWVGLITGLSLVATLVTPYFYQPYKVFLTGVTSAANAYLPDYKAMSFHQPQHYVLLLLTMAAFFALGINRSRDLFQITLLAGCALLSFYAQRDIWLVALASIAVMGEANGRDETGTESEQGLSSNHQPLLAASLAVLTLVFVVAFRVPASREMLMAKVARNYPVAASAFIRDRHLPQPLFNAYEWGGFLTCYLPEYPVAIDSRTDLYGDRDLIQYSKVMNADLPYTEYPALTGARTILLPRHSLMGEALSTVPAFHVAYSDDVATVLTRGSDD